MSNMYKDTEVWPVFKGCRFNCTYCIPSFQRQSKRWGANNCDKCYNYEPHIHEERLNKIPSSEIVFVAGSSDLFFCSTKDLKRIIEKIKAHNPIKEKTFYFQSKVPSTFERIKEDLPKNSVILTTVETNKHLFSDGTSYGDYSKAQTPAERLKDFIRLDYERKVITVEPIMEFNRSFAFQLSKVPNLEYIWVGYNTRPDEVSLPEPSKKELSRFLKQCKERDIEVRYKDIRGLDKYDGS